MLSPVFCSYYTPAYSDEAHRLCATLRVCRLDHHILPVPDLGSWEKNSHYLPVFVRDMMLRYEPRPIVWLDADTRVRRPPAELLEFADQGVDFAARLTGGHVATTSVLLLSNRRPSWNLVREWERQDQKQDRHPVLALEAALAQFSGDTLPTASLSREYCVPVARLHMDGPAVIEHMRVSRLLLPPA